MGKIAKFTFEDTGIEVGIRKVSPLFIADARTEYVKKHAPEVPSQRINYGTEEQPNWIVEQNPADPDYLKALEALDGEIEGHIRRFIIRRGVICEVDLEAVREARQDAMEEFGVELDPDDKFVYVSYVCTGSQEDLQDLLTAIIRRSQPTEEEIANAVSSFPG